jgi:hypothetical protein
MSTKGLETAEFRSTFHDRFDEEALTEILKKQRDRVTRLKQRKSQEYLPQIFVCLDDRGHRRAMHQAHNTVTSLAIRGSHLGVSTWLSVQSTIHPAIRANPDAILTWALRNKKELWDGLSPIRKRCSRCTRWPQVCTLTCDGSRPSST